MSHQDEQWYKSKHEEIWQWLADNPTKDKDQWGGWYKLTLEQHPREHNYCFACKWGDETMHYLDHRCEHCPCWEYPGSYDNNGTYMCEDKDSPYLEWDNIGGCYDLWDDDWHEDDLKRRTELALEIKKMWREIE